MKIELYDNFWTHNVELKLPLVCDFLLNGHFVILTKNKIKKFASGTEINDSKSSKRLGPCYGKRSRQN